MSRPDPAFLAAYHSHLAEGRRLAEAVDALGFWLVDEFGPTAEYRRRANGLPGPGTPEARAALVLYARLWFAYLALRSTVRDLASLEGWSIGLWAPGAPLSCSDVHNIYRPSTPAEAEYIERWHTVLADAIAEGQALRRRAPSEAAEVMGLGLLVRSLGLAGVLDHERGAAA